MVGGKGGGRSNNMATHDFAAHASHAHEAPQGFIRKWVFSLDHKVIGLQYYFSGARGGVRGHVSLAADAHSLDLAGAALPILGEIKPETYLTLVTMHGTIMVFFVLTTAPQGGFGKLLPADSNRRAGYGVPVLNMLSFWTTLLGFIVMIAAFFVAGGAPLHGWTGYAPLSALQSAGPGEGLGADLWIISIAIFCIGALMCALNFISRRRWTCAPRAMTMMRMPLTVWAWFVTAILGFARVRRAALGGHSVVDGPQSGHELFLFRSGTINASSRAIRAAHRFCAASLLVLSDILRCTSRFCRRMACARSCFPFSRASRSLDIRRW